MHLKLKKNALLIEDSSGLVSIKSPWVNVKLGYPSPLQHHALFLLAHEGATEERLTHPILKNEPAENLAIFYSYLEILTTHALLTFTVQIEDQALLQLVPLPPRFHWNATPIEETSSFKLSSFCFSQQIHPENTLETPLQTAQVIVKNEEIAQGLYLMLKPLSFAEICHNLPMYPPPIVKKCLLLLKNAKMLDESGRDPIEINRLLA